MNPQKLKSSSEDLLPLPLTDFSAAGDFRAQTCLLPNGTQELDALIKTLGAL